jgi:hypothetical protein
MWSVGRVGYTGHQLSVPLEGLSPSRKLLGEHERCVSRVASTCRCPRRNSHGDRRWSTGLLPAELD